MGGGGTRTSWEMMGWTEADNKNPHASVLFFPYFLLIFSHSAKPFGSQTLFGKFCLPSLYLIPQQLAQESAIIHHPLPVCLRRQPADMSVSTRPAKIRPPRRHSPRPPPCPGSPAPCPRGPAHTPPAARPARSGPAQSHHLPEPSAAESRPQFPLGQR